MTNPTRIYKHSSAGPLGWLCDSLATAVMVGGQESAEWFGQPELAL
jgi:hypothetical protein